MTKSALLIEDDAHFSRLLEVLLLASDYTVEKTTSGLDGLIRFTRGSFDLVLLDTQIDDLSGHGTHRAIRDVCPDAVVVCMSAQRSSWEADAHAQGAIACLQKPFGPMAFAVLLDGLSRRLVGSAEPGTDADVPRSEDPERPEERHDADAKSLPRGAFRVDGEVRVTTFDGPEPLETETGAGSIIGRRLADVVQSASARAFMAEFNNAVEARSIDDVLRLTYPLGGKLHTVSVRLYYDGLFEQRWVFISLARERRRHGARGEREARVEGG